MSYVQFNKDVIGYKKVVNKGEAYIITLLIPKHTTIHSGMLGEIDEVKSRNARCSVVDTVGTVIEVHAKLCGEHNTARMLKTPKSDYLDLCTMDILPFIKYKCRSECAEVLEIKNMRTGRTVDEIYNLTSPEKYIRELLYEVGEMVYPHEFGTYTDDGSHPPTCYGGIHFFPEKWMAEEYSV